MNAARSTADALSKLISCLVLPGEKRAGRAEEREKIRDEKREITRQPGINPSRVEATICRNTIRTSCETEEEKLRDRESDT